MFPRIGRPTIREVASAAGVSTQTVSRVINNRPDVSPKTRQRVQEVIDQLGFQPSALARSLIHQRSYTLGVFTAGLKYIGPSRTLSGITRAAEKAGYSLVFTYCSALRPEKHGFLRITPWMSQINNFIGRFKDCGLFDFNGS